jgi:hypothetical protein
MVVAALVWVLLVDVVTVVGVVATLVCDVEACVWLDEECVDVVEATVVALL